MPFMALRERAPIVKAILDNGDGDILIEGGELTQRDVFFALKARFPDEAQFRSERTRVLFVLADGTLVRFWRFANETPRVVDGKIIL